MTGNLEVIAALQEVISQEWTASEVFLVQSQLWTVRGYCHAAKLSNKWAHRSRKNLRKLTEQVSLLGAVPTLKRADPDWNGTESLIGQFQANLTTLSLLKEAYDEASEAAEEARDWYTVDVCEYGLKPTVHAIEELEARISLYKDLGEANWCQEQA